MRFLLSILVLLLETAALASPTGKVGYSGKQVKTCSKCHSGGTVPYLELTGPTTLAAGERGAYSLLVVGTGAEVGGVGISATFGQLFAIDDRTKISSGEITHRAPIPFVDSELRIDFELVAPADGTDVTLFAAANAANGDKKKTGDAADAIELQIVVGDPVGDVVPAEPIPDPVDTNEAVGCQVATGDPGLGVLLLLAWPLLRARRAPAARGSRPRLATAPAPSTSSRDSRPR